VGDFPAVARFRPGLGSRQAGFAQLSHSAQKLSDLHKKSIRAWLPPLIVDSVSFGFRAHSIENKILFFNG